MTTRSDYVRTDELAEAAVRVDDLPRLFNASRSTIDAWIKADKIPTFPYPTWNGSGRAPLAVRWGSIPLGEHATRWRKKTNRKST